MSTTQKLKASSYYEIAIFLTIAGGALDAYTFASRGGVFANAQTGNIIRLGIFLADGKYRACLPLVFSMIAFGLGTWLTLVIQHNFYKIKPKFSRRCVLLVEMLMILLVAFISQGEVYNIIANGCVSFLAAMQMEAFKKFSGQVMTTTVTTGNYRKCIEFLYKSFKEKDITQRQIAYRYMILVGCFISGGFIGMKLAMIFEIRSILFEIIPLSVVFMMITIKYNALKKEEELI